MDGADILMSSDVEAMVTRLGSLPDAPLVMPKQRLEAPATLLSGIIGRLIGRPTVAVGDARRSGQ